VTIAAAAITMVFVDAEPARAQVLESTASSMTSGSGGGFESRPASMGLLGLLSRGLGD
jgi:hypothetical protein